MYNKQTSFSKKLKIIFINLLLFILLFHIVDFYASIVCTSNWLYKVYKESKIIVYLRYYNLIHNYKLQYDKVYSDNFITCDKYSKSGDRPSWALFRPIENISVNKSIIIFGCSYAYGSDLANNDTFSYNLGMHLQSYKIYNRARNGWTTSHMLYQLENKDFSDVPNVKYVIYTYIFEHISRNCWNSFTCTPIYNINRNNILQFRTFSLKNMNIPLGKLISDKIKCMINKKIYKGKEIDKIMLTKKIVEKSKINIEEKFGKETKFIILRYDNGGDEPYNWVFDELKKEGIIVVSLKDLSDTNYISKAYQISDNLHPNARAWREITPLFVKYLQDRGYLKD